MARVDSMSRPARVLRERGLAAPDFEAFWEQAS